MKNLILSLIVILFLSGFSTIAQIKEQILDLSAINETDVWTLHNREIVKDDIVHLNGQPGDGLLWINDLLFKDGTIEVHIKGIDERGRSFVGIAFHILNDSTFDAIYFRPFNFKSPERKGHSVQYISHPEYPWHKLRADSPEKYENPVTPVPDPSGWFHATIIVKYPDVKVFVNNSEEASLVVEQLSSRKQGKLGFWVGNNSEGWFKNLKIISEK